jgi:hypothetical protein
MPVTRPDRPAQADPRQSAPVGAYLTDGKALLVVLESDWQGVLCENVATEFNVDIERVELAQGWRRVRPAA